MDGSGLTPRARAPWNPLRVDGTSLPPGWLLAAKLLAFAVFRGPRFLGAGPPFLPFVSILDWPGFAGWLAPLTAATFYVSFLGLCFNRMVRVACVAIAGCVLIHVAGHRLEYANNLMFAAVFLLLIGLYDPRTGLWPLRIQLALVYAGASLNKALDADWWTGRFFDTLMVDALGVRWYTAVAGSLPEHFVGAFFGVATMLAEATICTAVLVSRRGRAGVWLTLLFHASILVATGGQLSLPFTYGSLAISAAFLFSSRHESTPWIVPAIWWAAALCIRAIPHIRSLT